MGLPGERGGVGGAEEGLRIVTGGILGESYMGTMPGEVSNVVVDALDDLVRVFASPALFRRCLRDGVARSSNTSTAREVIPPVSGWTFSCRYSCHVGRSIEAGVIVIGVGISLKTLSVGATVRFADALERPEEWSEE